MLLQSLHMTAPPKTEQYPFHLALIQNLKKIEFTNPITFLVGENGSGKSTLLESIAVAVNSITIGNEPVATDPTLNAVRQLAACMKLHWKYKRNRGFFMRAEDFFNFVKQQEKTRTEMFEHIEEVKETYKDRSPYAQALAMQPYARSLHEINAKYGENLDANSHGESFFEVFSSRLVPNGLYLMDEPEAALSPMRQLAFIVMLQDAVKDGSQFIIATHSPILLAYPGAKILEVKNDQLQETPYDQLEHVQFTKSFLENPQRFLRHLQDD